METPLSSCLHLGHLCWEVGGPERGSRSGDTDEVSVIVLSLGPTPGQQGFDCEALPHRGAQPRAQPARTLTPAHSHRRPWTRKSVPTARAPSPKSLRTPLAGGRELDYAGGMPIETIRWEGGRPGHVRLLDQTLLPTEHRVIEIANVPEMVDAIYRLAVRGAPAIGVAAAFGVVLGVQHLDHPTAAEALEAALESASTLAKARPTAVNLFWALERMSERARAEHAGGASGEAIVAALFEEAERVYREDREICAELGRVGAELLGDGQTILTHCNAGALATAGIGTALAPVYTAAAQGKRVAVYADETRPLLQGARLTAWELAQAGVQVTLITDGMAGRVLFEGRIDAVFVGADRIARNGDVCNKIGTYSVAVLAREHGVPFYCVAPLSTFDPKLEHGGLIPIEERPPEEVTQGFGRSTAPPGIGVYNPAFDVTPARLVSGIVTEVGLVREPTTEKVERALRRGGLPV